MEHIRLRSPNRAGASHSERPFHIGCESRMEASLTAIVVWLAIHFPMPASFDYPCIKSVSAAEMIAPADREWNT